MRYRIYIIFFIVLALIVFSADFKQSAFAQTTYTSSFVSSANAVSSLFTNTAKTKSFYTSSAGATGGIQTTNTAKTKSFYTSTAKAVSYGYATPPRPTYATISTTYTVQQPTQQYAINWAINANLTNTTTLMLFLLATFLPAFAFYFLKRDMISLLSGLFVGFLLDFSLGITYAFNVRIVDLMLVTIFALVALIVLKLWGVIRS